MVKPCAHCPRGGRKGADVAETGQDCADSGAGRRLYIVVCKHEAVTQAEQDDEYLERQDYLRSGLVGFHRESFRRMGMNEVMT